MIPKTIHFCWLSGDPYPEKIATCIDSWKRLLPDYTIKQWSLSNFDINKHPWVKEAYMAKKFAFAADYIRCYALFHEGGIYLDSDVEVLKPFDELLELPYFIGLENGGAIEAAVMGAEKGGNLFGEMVSYYENRHFYNDGFYDERPLPKIMLSIFENMFGIDLIANDSEFSLDKTCIQILPYDYFSPKSYKTGELCMTNRTFSIHHFSASWLDPISKLAQEYNRKMSLIPQKPRGYIAMFFANVKIYGISYAMNETINWIKKSSQIP